MRTSSEAAAKQRFPEFIWIGLVAVLVGALLVFGFFHFLQRREPSYRGKPISLWISVYQIPSSLAAPASEAGKRVKIRVQEARQAILSFGPAALPYLAAAMDNRETPMLRHYRQLVDKLPSSLRLRLQPPLRKPSHWLIPAQCLR